MTSCYSNPMPVNCISHVSVVELSAQQLVKAFFPALQLSQYYFSVIALLSCRCLDQIRILCP